MTAADVLALLDRLEAAGVEAWVEGGWGIDALAGAETRPHEDLDLVLPADHWDAAVATLQELGLRVDDRRSQPPSSLFLGNERFRVDLHPVVLDSRGNGWQRGGPRAWDLYPAEGFEGRGTIGGRAVRCLTAAVQLRHHLGYEWDDGDLHDLRLLAERFGIPLPPDVEPEESRGRRAIGPSQRRQIVASAYDELGARFGRWASSVEGEPLDRFLDELCRRLPEGSPLLDLGCGDGAKTTRLAERFEVIGVDLSDEQLRLARGAVPETMFVQGDVLQLDLPDESFDAVTAFYSFMHVPRDEQPALLARIREWLKPGGLFLAPLSVVGGPDRVENWLGVEMFFSGWDAETNRRLVREAGLDLLVDEVVAMREPDSGYETAFLWVLAERPEGAAA